MRLFAKFLSYVLHPLTILTYVLLLMLLIQPHLFGVNDIMSGGWLILMMFMSTFLIPAFAVFLMKMLDLISSFEMPDRMERIAPYVATGIFYLWMSFHCYHSPVIPMAYTVAVAGSTIALFIAFFLNLFTKISAHTVGMGGLAGMMLIVVLLFSYDTFRIDFGSLGMVELSTATVLLAVVILAGLVGTARLYLHAHEPKDIYGGYLVGFASQFIALRFLF